MTLPALTPGQTKVAAKALVEQGYSSRKIEELLGIDNVSAWRYAKEATPDELKQFETDFKVAIGEMKNKGLALVHKRLLDLIPKERRIDQVVKAGEYLEGKSQGNTNIQVNVPILGGITKEKS